MGVVSFRCMSLNAKQQAATAAELDANLRLSGLTVDGLAARTGLPTDRVRAALAVDGGHPVDVWVLRDALEDAVVEAGGTPQPYSTLTEANRASAERWFGYRRGG
jgi:hypothetical protein